MYKKILIALENSKTDAALVDHVAALAAKLGSELVLVHVADGFAARNFDQLSLRESQEMKDDLEYLTSVGDRLAQRGLSVQTHLALGNPPQEIVKTAEQFKCDLIAMMAHGHKLVADLILGSTIEPVRHNTLLPVLIVRDRG